MSIYVKNSLQKLRQNKDIFNKQKLEECYARRPTCTPRNGK